MEKVTSAEYVTSAHSPEGFVRDGRPQVAFVGRSNVGKSSLLNALLGRRGLARISSTPGRTQAVNYFLVNERIYFVDLPGYGFAKTSKAKREGWADLMEAYFSEALPGAEVVLLLDGKIAGTDLDRDAWEYLVAMGGDPIVVATKIDKVPRGRRRKAVDAVRRRLGLAPDRRVIEFSATTQEGLKELSGAIGDRLDQSA